MRIRAPKAGIYYDQSEVLKEKNLIFKYIISSSSLFANNNMQMVKVFSTKKSTNTH
jgi:hypothetical protein